MSRYEMVTLMRRELAPEGWDGAETRHDDQGADPITQRQTSHSELYGIRFQRCGGGVRVVRKKIGGD